MIDPATSEGDEEPIGFPVGTVVRTVAVHPSLWWTALTTVVRLAAPGWWRRWPPLPLPADDYWRFRMVTLQGGRGDRPLERREVLAYLRWCRGAARRSG